MGVNASLGVSDRFCKKGQLKGPTGGTVDTILTLPLHGFCPFKRPRVALSEPRHTSEMRQCSVNLPVLRSHGSPLPRVLIQENQLPLLTGKVPLFQPFPGVPKGPSDPAICLAEPFL